MDNGSCSVPECDSPARDGGFCWPHWARWEAFGDPRDARRMRNKSVRARLFSRVIEDTTTGCWNWQGSKDRDGYGLFKIIDEATGNWTTTGAHRAVWVTLIGPILAESLDHLCRNRACCNPDHLEPVSMQVNTLRGDTMAAKYSNRTHCGKGHAFDTANTAWRPDGYRLCRTCRDDAGRRRAKRQAANTG